MKIKFNKPVKLSLLLEMGNLDYVSNLNEVGCKTENKAKELQERQAQILRALVQLQEDIVIFEYFLLNSWSSNEIKEAIELTNQPKN